jgi:tetratricopeptide (TPR) repeat protein
MRGIAAARAGRRSEARALLMRVVERDERNEQAWLWLSGVVDEPAEVQTCLENVLELNPGNTRARQGLEWIRARTKDQGPTTDGRQQTTDSRRLTADDQSLMSASAVPATSGGASAHDARLTAHVSSVAALPCPYCGAPTSERQERCTQCRHSLMVQLPPPEQPSRWLGALATAWSGAGALLALGGVTYLGAALLAYQTARFGGAQERPDAPLPLGLVTVAVVLLVLSGAAVALGGALRRRAMAAYSAAVILVPVALVLTAAALIREAPAANLASAGIPPVAVAALGTALGGLLAALAGVLLVAAVLGGMAYRDFFGPVERLKPVLEPADPTTHYNNGVGYKNRGMWYAATREWERAVAGAPRDINYLRALGLAYAQLGQVEPAREMLGRALGLAPGHTQLAEDLAVVEERAQQAAASR